METRQALSRRAARSGACMAIVVATSAAQVFAQNVTIGPRLRAGDTFRLEVMLIREDSARPQRDGRSRTPVDVKVASVTANGAVVEWTPGDSELDYPRMAPDPTLAAAAAAVRNVSFRLNLNAEGVLTGLANETEIALKLQASVDAFVNDLSARLPEAQRAAFQSMVAQVLSPEALIATSRRGAEVFFLMNGFVLAPGEVSEVRLQAPSPVGGIPGTFRVELASATAAFASLKTTTTYDPAGLMRLAQAFALQGGAPMPPDEPAKPFSMQMTDDGQYTFDRTVGLMREIVVNRRIVLGDSRRLEGWEIRLIQAPKS